MIVFGYDSTCALAISCACMRFPLFSHSGTLSSDRCANQSAEKERWERLSGGDKIWSKPSCLSWEKYWKQNKGQSCWIQKIGAGVQNLLLWTLFQMLCWKYYKHSMAGTHKIKPNLTERLDYSQLTQILYDFRSNLVKILIIQTV